MYFRSTIHCVYLNNIGDIGFFLKLSIFASGTLYYVSCIVETVHCIG